MATARHKPRKRPQTNIGTPGIQYDEHGVQKLVEFTNSVVRQHFTCTKVYNCIVHVPNVYRGLLSDINIAAARAMYDQKHAAVKPIEKP